MNANDWIAVYAAIVATGALALEVRRWFESGPKIHVTAKPGMMLVGVKGVEYKDLLVVNAVNRGDVATTITHLCILEYANLWTRLRHRPSSTFIILHPNLPDTPPIIPHVLKVGEQWTGFGYSRSDVTGNIQTGKMWAAVYTTDRQRPYIAHIPKKSANELENAEEV